VRIRDTGHERSLQKDRSGICRHVPSTSGWGLLKSSGAGTERPKGSKQPKWELMSTLVRMKRPNNTWGTWWTSYHITLIGELNLPLSNSCPDPFLTNLKRNPWNDPVDIKSLITVPKQNQHIIRM
jgi:hypothetical protein